MDLSRILNNEEKCEESKKFYVYRQEGVMFIYKYKRFSFGFFFLVKMLVKGEKRRGSCLVIQGWGRKG